MVGLTSRVCIYIYTYTVYTSILPHPWPKAGFFCVSPSSYRKSSVRIWTNGNQNEPYFLNKQRCIHLTAALTATNQQCKWLVKGVTSYNPFTTRLTRSLRGLRLPWLLTTDIQVLRWSSTRSSPSYLGYLESRCKPLASNAWWMARLEGFLGPKTINSSTKKEGWKKDPIIRIGILNYPWTPFNPRKMKVLHPQYMGFTTPKKWRFWVPMVGGGNSNIFVIFTPKIGEDFQFDEYLSDGLKPPTS